MVDKGDIVFCRVESCGEYYTHMVLSKRWDWKRHEDYWMIGNARGRTRRLVYLKHIFGKCVDAT